MSAGSRHIFHRGWLPRSSFAAYANYFVHLPQFSSYAPDTLTEMVPEGNPSYKVKMWDGTTVDVPWDGYGQFRKFPTSYAGKRVAAVGPGTPYALKLTPQQFYYWYWRPYEVKFTTLSGSVSVSTSGTTAHGGHLDPPTTPGGDPVWVETSADVPGSSADLDFPDLQTLTRTNDGVVAWSQEIKYQRTKATYATRHIKDYPEFDLIASGGAYGCYPKNSPPGPPEEDSIPFPATYIYKSDTNTGRYDGPTADCSGETLVEAYTNFTTGNNRYLYWPLGSEFDFGAGRGAYFVDGNFWVSVPMAFSLKASVESTTRGDQESGPQIFQRGRYTKAYDTSSGLFDTDYGFVFRSGHMEDGTLYPAPELTTGSDERLKIQLVLGSATITGEFMTHVQSYDDSISSSPEYTGQPDGYSQNHKITLPTIKAELNKFYTLGGMFNENTGAKI